MFSNLTSLFFYIASFSVSSAMMMFVAKNDKKRTFFYLIMILIAFGVPIVMAGYRTCGTDSLTYIQSYLGSAKSSWGEVFEGIETYFESGHKLLTRFLGIFKSVRIYFAAYASITLILVYKITKFLKNEAVALPMFIYLMLSFSASFNGMRQHLAAAIVLFSFKFVFERDFIKFVLCIAISTAFHTSSAIMVFVYFIWKKDGEMISWFFLAIILAVVALVSFNLESILNRMGEYDFESESLQRYAGYSVDTHETMNRDFYLRLIVTGACLFYYKSLVEIDKRNSFFLFLMIVGAILGVCGFVSPAAKRIGLYFNIVNMWVLADIPKVFKDHHSIWGARIIVVTYVVGRFWLVYYILGQSHMIPYIWYLPGWVGRYFN